MRMIRPAALKAQSGVIPRLDDQDPERRATCNVWPSLPHLWQEVRQPPGVPHQWLSRLLHPRPTAFERSSPHHLRSASPVPPRVAVDPPAPASPALAAPLLAEYPAPAQPGSTRLAAGLQATAGTPHGVTARANRSSVLFIELTQGLPRMHLATLGRKALACGLQLRSAKPDVQGLSSRPLPVPSNA